MKKEIPSVLILLASYNGEVSIKRQIDSILSQLGVTVDVLVSDDCSTDATVKLIKEYTAVGAPVKLISTNRRFGSAAPNFFYLSLHCNIEEYDYVAFSDQDDIWFEDKIISAIRDIIREDVSGFSSNVIAFWPESKRKQVINKSQKSTGIDHWFESPGPGCSQVFTASSFKKFQLFISVNEKRLAGIDYHDWLIYAFYQFNELGWYISEKPKMLYVQHASNQIGANSGLSALIRRFKMIRSLWYREQIENTYKLVSGRKAKLINLSFIANNSTKLRRKIKDSLAITVLFMIGLL